LPEGTRVIAYPVPAKPSFLIRPVLPVVLGGNPAARDAAIEQLKNQLDTYNNYGANLDQHGNVV